MLNRRTVLSVCLGLLLLGSDSRLAQAEPIYRISLTGILNFSDTYIDVGGMDLDTSRRLGYGGGVLAELAFSESIGVETGLLYIQRNYEYGRDTFRLAQTASMLQLPLVFRYWLSDFITFMGGAYAAFGLGGLSTEFELGDDAAVGFDSSARRGVELGLTLGAGLNFAIADKSGFFVEARYSRGLTDVAEPEIVEQRLDDISFLLGVRFSVSGS